MTRSPGRSVWRRALALGMGRKSVRKNLKLYLKFYPYKIVCVHELEETDYLQKLAFATYMQVLPHNEPDGLIVMSHEARFYLNETVKRMSDTGQEKTQDSFMINRFIRLV